MHEPNRKDVCDKTLVGTMSEHVDEFSIFRAEKT